jgi:hypothetical protein
MFNLSFDYGAGAAQFRVISRLLAAPRIQVSGSFRREPELQASLMLGLTLRMPVSLCSDLSAQYCLAA